jgi:hypothetical protein
MWWFEHATEAATSQNLPRNELIDLESYPGRLANGRPRRSPEVFRLFRRKADPYRYSCARMDGSRSLLDHYRSQVYAIRKGHLI